MIKGIKTYHRVVTPAQLSSSILSLCNEILPGATPQYVDVKPIPEAQINSCFILVNEYTQKYGGRCIIGWSIWEWPSLFVEAEFHSVWQAHDGYLLDITPKNYSTKRILFLQDPSRQYEGKQVNNIRKAISKHPDIQRFLDAADAEYQIMNRGERSTQHGEIVLMGQEMDEYNAIKKIKDNCLRTMLRLKSKIDIYDPCLCGSGKKVKWCHGLKK